MRDVCAEVVNMQCDTPSVKAVWRAIRSVDAIHGTGAIPCTKYSNCGRPRKLARQQELDVVAFVKKWRNTPPMASDGLVWPSPLPPHGQLRMVTASLVSAVSPGPRLATRWLSAPSGSAVDPGPRLGLGWLWLFLCFQPLGERLAAGNSLQPPVSQPWTRIQGWHWECRQPPCCQPWSRVPHLLLGIHATPSKH